MDTKSEGSKIHDLFKRNTCVCVFTEWKDHVDVGRNGADRRELKLMDCLTNETSREDVDLALHNWPLP